MAEITNEVMDNVVDEINEAAANEGYGLGATIGIVAVGTIVGNLAMKGICCLAGKVKKSFKKDEIAEVIYDEESEVE